MIKFDEAKQKLKRDISNLENNEIIIIECFKKDRQVSILKINNNYVINENGYIKKQETINNPNECIKYVIKRINFQFPNSKNLWYHKQKIIYK